MNAERPVHPIVRRVSNTGEANSPWSQNATLDYDSDVNGFTRTLVRTMCAWVYAVRRLGIQS
jgi:hypothetical protein